MAPTIEPEVITLIPWPLFTAMDVDGTPLEGGRLFTMAANTTTPKASFADPYYVVPNTNPVILNADGQAVVWLNGPYHLRLEDADGVQLWDVLSYEYPNPATPSPGGVQTGMNEATGVTPTPGSGVISVPNLIPLGYRVLGVIVRIDVALGTSQGVTAVDIGDAVATDRWGRIGITAGATTTQQSFHAGDEPIAHVPYTVLLSSIGGLFDATGSFTIRATYQAIDGWS
jgi:hypothetical protein